MKITKQRIKEIIREELLREGRLQTQFQIPTREQKKVDAILRKANFKEGRDFDYGVGKGPTFILAVEKKFENKILSLLVQKGIRKIHEI